MAEGKSRGVALNSTCTWSDLQTFCTQDHAEWVELNKSGFLKLTGMPAEPWRSRMINSIMVSPFSLSLSKGLFEAVWSKHSTFYWSDCQREQTLCLAVWSIPSGRGIDMNRLRFDGLIKEKSLYDHSESLLLQLITVSMQTNNYSSRGEHSGCCIMTDFLRV